MIDVINNSTPYLSASDINAIATYLKSLPAASAQTAIVTRADEPGCRLVEDKQRAFACRLRQVRRSFIRCASPPDNVG